MRKFKQNSNAQTGTDNTSNISNIINIGNMKKSLALFGALLLTGHAFADSITNGIGTAGDAIYSYTPYVQALGYVLFSAKLRSEAARLLYELLRQLASSHSSALSSNSKTPPGRDGGKGGVFS